MTVIAASPGSRVDGIKVARIDLGAPAGGVGGEPRGAQRGSAPAPPRRGGPAAAGGRGAPRRRWCRSRPAAAARPAGTMAASISAKLGVGGERAFDDDGAFGADELEADARSSARGTRRRRRRAGRRGAPPRAPTSGAARPGKGPEPGSTAGKSMTPCASTASTSAGVTVGSRPSIIRDHSRPPMKRADGTGSPKALTLISVSRAGSSATRRPPIAMATTQVPVETTAKGGRRARRCGRSEALESWMPQCTGVAGSRPVAAATSGVTGPRTSAARRSGGMSGGPAHAGRPATRRRRRAGSRGRCGSRARCARRRARR